jgi:hypothetical protein
MNKFIKITDYYSETTNYIRKSCIYNIQTEHAESGYFIRFFISANSNNMTLSIKYPTEEKMNEALTNYLAHSLNENIM